MLAWAQRQNRQHQVGVLYLVSSTFCILQAQCLHCIGLSAGKQAAPYQSAAVEGCTSLHCHWPGLGSADRSWLQSQWQKDFRKHKSRCHNTLLRSKLRRRARHCIVRSSMPPSSPRIQNWTDCHSHRNHLHSAEQAVRSQTVWQRMI
jgi:hypothetical protein